MDGVDGVDGVDGADRAGIGFRAFVELVSRGLGRDLGRVAPATTLDEAGLDSVDRVELAVMLDQLAVTSPDLAAGTAATFADLFHHVAGKRPAAQHPDGRRTWTDDLVVQRQRPGGASGHGSPDGRPGAP